MSPTPPGPPDGGPPDAPGPFTIPPGPPGDPWAPPTVGDPWGPPPGPPPGAWGAPPGPPPGAWGAPPGPPPGAWGAPSGWAGRPPAQDHPQGVVVLILGICGIVTCPLLGPVAWHLGRKTLAEIDAEPGRYGNRGLVQAGYICGIVGSVILGLYLAFAVLWFGFFFLAAGASTVG